LHNQTSQESYDFSRGRFNVQNYKQLVNNFNIDTEFFNNLKKCEDYSKYNFGEICDLLTNSVFYIKFANDYILDLGYNLEWDINLISPYSPYKIPGAFGKNMKNYIKKMKGM